MQTICDLPEWWELLTYDGLNYHVNVTEALFFSEERIKIGKEEAGSSIFYQAPEKFQVNQDKAQTRQLLELEFWKVHGRIN